jgi:hypothetical protein
MVSPPLADVRGVASADILPRDALMLERDQERRSRGRTPAQGLQPIDLGQGRASRADLSSARQATRPPRLGWALALPPDAGVPIFCSKRETPMETLLDPALWQSNTASR